MGYSSGEVASNWERTLQGCPKARLLIWMERKCRCRDGRIIGSEAERWVWSCNYHLIIPPHCSLYTGHKHATTGEVKILIYSIGKVYCYF